MHIQKTKCLFVLPDLSGGGAEKVTLTLLRHLDREKFIPTLFLFKAEGAFIAQVPEDVDLVVGLDHKYSIWLEWIKILQALIKVSKKQDVIVGSLELKGIFFAVLGAFFARKPAISWVHKHLGVYFKLHSLKHRFFYWLGAALTFTLARRVVAVSQESAINLKHLFPWCESKVTYHYNPIDYAAIDREISKYNNEYEVKSLLAVGRLTPQKGFDVLLKAMDRLVKNRPKSELLILGEGEQRGHLENLSESLGISNSVHLLGFHSPYYAMAHTDIFVMSSRYEGLPTVMLEAMYCGAAIVSTKCPSGPTEILENGKYGVLVDVDDEEQLAEAIVALLDDVDRLAEFKLLAKSRAKKFALDVVCREWQEDLELIGSKK